MKIPFGIYKGVQKAPLKKIDKYIEIAASSKLRLTAIDRNSRSTILAVLRKHYQKVGVTIVDDMAGLEKLVAKKPDLVVLGMKLILLDPSKGYDDSPKVWLSSYLQERGITFTGSDTEALVIELDKHEAKQRVTAAGLQSPAHFISRVHRPTFQHNITFPMFVKPLNQGGSIGVDEKSVVYSESELKSKILSIHNNYGSDALVEEYLPGREFSAAVIKRPNSEDLLAMPIEITSPADKKGNSFLSESVKEADSEKVLAITDLELKNTVNALAIGVFKALGSRDYGRIDMRLDARGVPSFIEANLMPGLSNHGYLSRCFALNEHITYDDMILSIINLGFERVARLPAKAVSTILDADADEAAAARLANAGLIV